MQVWTSEDLFDNMLALGSTHVVACHRDSNARDATAASMREGSLPDGVEPIALDSLRSVRINKTSQTITIKKADGRNAVYAADSHAQRDEIFEAFKAAMPAYPEAAQDHSPFTALRGPAIAAIAALVVTALLFGAVDDSDTAVNGRRRGLARLLGGVLDALGQVGVLIVGALVLTAIAKAAVSRYSNPPEYRTLERAQ